MPVDFYADWRAKPQPHRRPRRATGLAAAWNPDLSDPVHALALSGATLYVGGDFYSIGGKRRSGLAAFDTVTGNVIPWHADASDVLSMAISGERIYMGGWFTNIGGQDRNRLAALNATTGAVIPWNPDANGPVYSLVISGTTIYVAGGFSMISGQFRHHLAADASSTRAKTQRQCSTIPLYIFASLREIYRALRQKLDQMRMACHMHLLPIRITLRPTLFAGVAVGSATVIRIGS